MYRKVEGRNVSAVLNARPLVIVTVVDDHGVYNACTAAWATPVSHEPPMVALALRPGSKTAQILKDEGEAVLNTIDLSHADLASTLGSRSGNAFDKHALLKDLVQPAQKVAAPALTNAVAHLECALGQVVSTGDHDLFVLEVVYADSRDEVKENLLYSNNTLLMLQRESFGLFQEQEPTNQSSGETDVENNQNQQHPVFDIVSLRPAKEEEREVINELLASEGFFSVTTVEGITVAVNEDDEMVGFVRVVDDDEGCAHVYPVVIYETWRGFGVGRVLVEQVMRERGRVKLISRGYANEFYEALGFEKAPWEDMASFIVADCESCEMLEECEPQPYVYENTAKE